MNKCVECGSVSRNDRSHLCQECFDSALKKKIRQELKTWKTSKV